MKDSVAKEFGGARPRVIVLDDDDNARRMAAIKLERRGFAVTSCESKPAFEGVWKPGMFDLIVADWQLAQSPLEHGDKVLMWVRERDWDVPFILISGRLEDDHQKAPILSVLLNNGSARFVTRGDEGFFNTVCDQGEELLERRDMTLLKVLLALRPAADEGVSISTSSGEMSALDHIAGLVSLPKAAHDALRPISRFRTKAALTPPSR